VERGDFSPDDPGRFQPVAWDLKRNDQYMICADFEDYVRCQREVEQTYRDQALWTSKVIQNLAHVGKFSSDRTILEYAQEIWNVEPTPIKL